MFRKGFVLLEALITCAVVALTWYVLTHAAVQALQLEMDLEKKARALIAVASTVEKLRSGHSVLHDHTFTDDGMEIVVACQEKLFDGHLYNVTVKALVDSHEVVCLKTALLKN